MEARALMAICVLITIVAALLYHLPWAKPWMPGIALAALTIGLTATVLQALIARAERKRVESVVAAVLDRMNQALYAYLQAASNSWMQTNLGSFRDPLPVELDGWMQLLVDEFSNADNPDPFLRRGISPVLLAVALRDRLERVTDRHVVVLLEQLPDLFVALDRFDGEIEVLEQRAHAARLNAVSPADAELHEAMYRSLMEVRDFAEVYTQFGKPLPPELLETWNVDLSARHATEVAVRRELPSQPASSGAGQPLTGHT